MRDRTAAPERLFMMLIPLLGACPRDAADDVVIVPDCTTARDLVSSRNGRLVCKKPSVSTGPIQDCYPYSEALTSDGNWFSCTRRNNESQAARDALNNLYSTEKLIKDYTTRLGKLQQPSLSPIPFCGRTANMPSAAFQDGSLRGIAAAASTCGRLPSCGNTGHMCTVYEIYQSVINSYPTGPSFVGKAWVYMAAWAQEFSDNSGLQKEPGAGLADNCGGFTIGDSSKRWYGTAVSLAPTASGDAAIKLASGPPNVGVPGTTSSLVNTNAVACSAALPIACCR